MNRLTSISTGAIWDAVGFQTPSDAFEKLELEGWAKVATSDGYVVLIREKQTVHLYARNSNLGMIHVGTLASRVHAA